MSMDETRPTQGMIDGVLAIPQRRADIERHVNALGSVASAVLGRSLAAMRANQAEAQAGIAMIDMWVTSTLYADAIERELDRRSVKSDGGVQKVH